MQKKEKQCILIGSAVLALLFAFSLTVGDYSLYLSDLLSGNALSIDVFFTLRLPRTIMALLAGFGLSFTGYVYQSLLKNPIAAPDVIGVSSGASVGSGLGIVFFGGSVIINAVLAFFGGLFAVLLTAILAGVSKEMRIATLVLSGIAVNAFAQAILMLIKINADPERQLAALEYWTMGSLAGITQSRVLAVGPIIILCAFVLYKLNRQLILLSMDSDTAQMLGVSVNSLRISIMVIATVIVGAIVSVTGLITFIGLVCPHLSRLILKTHGKYTLLFAGILGGVLLLFSDIAARSLFASELPISVVTSVIGVPFLIGLIVKGGKV